MKLLLALIVASSVALVACTPTQPSSEITPAPEVGTEVDSTMTVAPDAEMNQLNAGTETDSAAGISLTGELDPATGVRTVEVEAGSFYYKPNLIRVQKGEKVKIVMNSVDMMHDFNIDELNVKVPVTKSGATATAEFTASEAGTFEFYCSVGQHRANGQVGTLIVE